MLYLYISLLEKIIQCFAFNYFVIATLYSSPNYPTSIEKFFHRELSI